MKPECEVAGANTGIRFLLSIVLDHYALRIFTGRALKKSPVMVGLI